MTGSMPGASNWRDAGWVKALVVGLVLLVGALAVRHSAGLVLAEKQPRLALRIDGENAHVQANAALALVTNQPTPEERKEARALASRALARDAGNVDALVALGVASDDQKQVAAAFTASERLSRRNLLTQLWLIESAVSRNDVPSALRHYDIALRTARSAPAILFPVLVNATTNDVLLPEIVKTLSRRPLWGELYVQQLAQSGPDQERIVALFTALKRRGIPIGAAAESALYARLLETQRFDLAWSVYAAGHRGTSRDAIRDGQFVEQASAPAPFDWQLTNNEFVNARIEQVSADKGELIFATSAGEGGEVAKQMLVLPNGNYMANVDVKQIEMADAAAPYLRVTCLPSGAELIRMPLPSNTMRAMRFSVPSGCPAQMLSLVVQPAAGLAAVNGAISSVQVTRVQ